MLDLDGAPADRVRLARMTQALVHRGPDGFGQYASGPFGVGHTRLAVLDLSDAAQQPMHTPDGRFTIAYNGEVYNLESIRQQLEATGESFRSHGDTEVVLRALATWGPTALARFNGMFAFALWDSSKRELWLTRDRYGIKPLYYAWIGRTLLFGSEVKALLAHGALTAALDPEGLTEYLTFQNFLTDRTLFQGVRLLPPATLWCLQVGEHAGRQRRWWDFDFCEPDAVPEPSHCLDELSALLARSLDRQLTSDVEVGSYLSGGLDSGALASLAARRIPNLKVFTCGFDLHSVTEQERNCDERSVAERIARAIQAEHYEVVVKPSDMERAIPRLTNCIEEPRVGQSYPNFLTARLAAAFVKVVLSGTGGDELFGGYPWRYQRCLHSRNLEQFLDTYYLYWQRLLPVEIRNQVLAPVWSVARHVDTRAIFRSVFRTDAPRPTRPEDYFHLCLHFDARVFLHGLLVVEDKISMAHGLETRVPFLDNDLVDFAMRLPARLKIGGFDGVAPAMNREGKLLLRRAMQPHLPLEVTERAKQGFSAPDASWFRTHSSAYVRRTLDCSTAKVYDFLDPSVVRPLVREHLDGVHDRRLLIWSLLSLESWCLHFL